MSANATKVGPDTHAIALWPLEDAFDLATILDSVLDTARSLIVADAHAVWLLEANHEEWQIAASRGLSRGFTAHMPGGSDAMPAMPVCAEDVEKLGLLSDRVLTYRSEGIRSLMAVPIFIQEQRRGTLVFYFHTPHSFSRNEIQIGKSLARLSSSALAATELYREQSVAKAEQRVAVQELKASQTQLRLIIDSVPGLVAYIDTEKRFRRVNRTFEQWFQKPMKSFLGLTVHEVVGAESYEQLAPRIAEVLAGHELQYEIKNRYPDATRDVLITYVPDLDDGGTVCGFVALVIDVTERRKAENALRKTEKLAAAGRLAASIAHEINNPLESVTNLLYLLNQEAQLSPAGREYLTMAEQELTRVSQIATQTLRFHRQSSRPGSVRMHEVLDAVYALYRPRFDRLGVVLERRYRDTEPILAFEGELRQLFANLIANALDAMPNGGHLLLRTRPLVRADGVRGIQVIVADTGQGVADEMRGRIFEPFVTSKGMTGTGLGLWVSKEIVRKHRGYIRLRSRTEGALRGTIFVTFLAESPSASTGEG
jgi:PAS domain S-box-containing protein